MAIPPQLIEIFKKQLNAFLAWPPVTTEYSLGDYGIFKNGIFTRLGNTRDFGIDFTHLSDQAGRMHFLSPGINIKYFVDDVQVESIPEKSANASIEFWFEKEQSVFIDAPVITKKSISNVNDLASQLVASGKWDGQWKIIVDLYEGQEVVMVTTNKANAKLGLTWDIPSEESKGNTALKKKSASGIDLSIIGATGVIALGVGTLQTKQAGRQKISTIVNELAEGNTSVANEVKKLDEKKLPNKNIIIDRGLDHPVDHPGGQKSEPPPGVEEPISPQSPEVSTPAEKAEASPVQLGASAPGSVKPKQEFTARFVAYIKEAEQEMKQKLKDLSPTAIQHLGIKECTWQKGTKVKVKLSANELTVDPAEDEFTWNGTSQIVDFDVSVPDIKEPAQTILRFDVFIDNIMVAKLRIDLEINNEKGEEKRQQVTADPFRTAFASYSSQDRLRVLDRVSEISRNGVDVFLDCMSMHPGEKWEPRLEKEIRERDSFLLFWSSSAMKSKWVDLEWRTALKERGIDRIEVHPLESPRLAPPPDELKELHFNDIYNQVRKDNEPM